MVEIVNASIAARASLANTAPTTPAGLAAYLDYVVAESIEDSFLMVMMKRKTSSDHWPVLRTGCQGCNRGKVLRFIVTTASLIPSLRQ
jgi:hypothetical protein